MPALFSFAIYQELYNNIKFLILGVMTSGVLALSPGGSHVDFEHSHAF